MPRGKRRRFDTDGKLIEKSPHHCTYVGEFLPRGKEAMPRGLTEDQKVAAALLELEMEGSSRKLRVARARKMLLGCMDCNYRRHPVALQFDHRPDEVKIHNIAGWPGDIESMIVEMDKCD